MSLTQDNCHKVIYEIVKKSKNCNDAIKELTKLKYPNSKEYIQEDHAKYFYEKYSKLTLDIKMDKEFTSKAYEINSKIFKEANVKK